jgi:hypothetical protein
VTGEYLRHPECEWDTSAVPLGLPVGKDGANGSVQPRGVFLQQLGAPPFPYPSLCLPPDVLDRPVTVGGLHSPVARAQVPQVVVHLLECEGLQFERRGTQLARMPTHGISFYISPLCG